MVLSRKPVLIFSTAPEEGWRDRAKGAASRLAMPPRTVLRRTFMLAPGKSAPLLIPGVQPRDKLSPERAVSRDQNAAVYLCRLDVWKTSGRLVRVKFLTV